MTRITTLTILEGCIRDGLNHHATSRRAHAGREVLMRLIACGRHGGGRTVGVGVDRARRAFVLQPVSRSLSHRLVDVGLDMPPHILPRIQVGNVHALTFISKAASAVFEEGVADLGAAARFARLALGSSRRAVVPFTDRVVFAWVRPEDGLRTRAVWTRSTPKSSLTKQS